MSEKPRVAVAGAFNVDLVVTTKRLAMDPALCTVVQDAEVATIDSAREQPTVEDVYRAEGGRLWRTLLVFTGDRELASDAVAEAFAQLIARGPGVADPARWVWRAGYRIAAGELSLRRSRSAPTQVTSSIPEPKEGVVDLMNAIQALPPRQRAVVVLHYLADLPTPEVGRLLGIAKPTVRVHLVQARGRLRAILEDDDG